MKKLFFTFLIAGLLIACDDDEQSEPVNDLTPEESAEAVANNLAENSAGLTQQVKSGAAISRVAIEIPDDGRIQGCGTVIDTIFTLSQDFGETATYDFDFSYDVEVVCEGLLPSSVDLSYSRTGSYNGARINTTGTGNGDWIMTGLSFSENNFIINGTVEISEDVISKIGNENSYNAQTTLLVSDLLIDKDSFEIQGGTASVTMTGTLNDGELINISGDIVFNGDGTATLSIQGRTFTIDLVDGSIN